jgi:hypothetical protein
MAEYHRIFDDEVSDGAMLPVVDIRATDASIVHSYNDIVR